MFENILWKLLGVETKNEYTKQNLDVVTISIGKKQFNREQYNYRKRQPEGKQRKETFTYFHT